MIESRNTPIAGISIPVGAAAASGSVTVGAPAGTATVLVPVRAEPTPPVRRTPITTPASTMTISAVRAERPSR